MMMEIDYTVSQLVAKATHLTLHDPKEDIIMDMDIIMDDVSSVQDVDMAEASIDDDGSITMASIDDDGSLPDFTMTDASDNDDGGIPDVIMVDVSESDDTLPVVTMVDASSDNAATSKPDAFSFAYAPQPYTFQNSSSSSMPCSSSPTSILRSPHKTTMSWEHSSAIAPYRRCVWFSQRSSSILNFDTAMPPSLLNL